MAVFGLIFLAAAVAAPPGYQVSRTSNGCTIYTGAALANGVLPLLAECTWADVSLAKVEGAFSRWEDHDLFFSAIVSSDVVRTDGGTAFVRQVHQASGISDRECVLKMQRSSAEGGTKFSWTLDSAMPAPTEKRVAVTYDDGYWLFVPRPEGGLSVTYALAYGPGGSVPGFMVRWFQGSGFEAALGELHQWMITH